jgi:hypothetical protein
MTEFFSRVSPSDAIPLFAIGLTFLCLLAISLGGIWYKYRKADMAARLKHEMLARGMSAEEIKTVLDAGEKL